MASCLVVPIVETSTAGTMTSSQPPRKFDSLEQGNSEGLELLRKSLKTVAPDHGNSNGEAGRSGRKHGGGYDANQANQMGGSDEVAELTPTGAPKRDISEGSDEAPLRRAGGPGPLPVSQRTSPPKR